MLENLRHQGVLAFKRLVYGRRGEPYTVNGHVLRYLPGTRPVRVSYVDSEDANTRYDALQVQLMSRHLAPGDTVIDIGAHCGQYSILMAALCGPGGRVVSFEPDPYARAMLLQNVKLNPGIKSPVIESLAVSDTAGEATLYSRGGNSQSSLARSAVEFTPEQTSEPITVRLTTLDDYLSEKALPEPRWVKIDAEGAEIRILKGAKRLLSGKARIICELHPYAWPEFGNTVDELRELVAAAGRRMRYLDQDAPMSEQAHYGTVLLEHVSPQ